MSRENLEGRKRGVELLRKMGAAKGCRSEWNKGKKRTLAWYSFNLRDLGSSTHGETLKNIADAMDETGADYHLDSSRYHDIDRLRSQFSCTVFFNHAEMLGDPELRPFAVELGLDNEAD